MATNDVSAYDVAVWMFDRLKKNRELVQEDIVHIIFAKFGKGFTYDNSSGNLAIGKDVLRSFNKITGNDVVWERSQRLWRFREKHDEPGRMQP